MGKKYLSVALAFIFFCLALFPTSIKASTYTGQDVTQDKISSTIDNFFRNTNNSRAIRQTYDNWMEAFRKNKGNYLADANVALGNIQLSVKLVTSIEEWNSAVEESVNKFSPKLRLLVYNFDKNIYDSTTYLKNVEWLGSYNVSFYSLSNTAYVDLTFSYKQGYTIVDAFENDKIYTLSATDRAVYDKALEIINKVTNEKMTDYQKELAIHDYLVNNADYDRTLTKFTPYNLLIEGTGVCEAYAQSMMLLMRMLGIPCIIVTGTSNGVSHAWNVVTIDGETYEVDVTWNDPISDKLILSRAYFNLTTEQMSKDHRRSQESKNAPISTATAANYFVLNNLVAKTDNNAKDIVLQSKRKGEKTIELYVPSLTQEKAKNILKTANIKCSYSVNGNILRVEFID